MLSIKYTARFAISCRSPQSARIISMYQYYKILAFLKISIYEIKKRHNTHYEIVILYSGRSGGSAGNCITFSISRTNELLSFLLHITPLKKFVVLILMQNPNYLIILIHSSYKNT